MSKHPLIFVTLATACASAPTIEPAATAPASSAASSPASMPASGPGSMPAAPALQRAAAGAKRLQKSAAGQVVLQATEAHGGLERWFAQGAIRFRYDYQPVKGARRNSVQTVDVIGARAYHTLDHPARGRFAFDGTQAWMKLEGDGKFAARFWALTPYYFVGMPFVLGDPGVKLELVDDDPKAAGLDNCDVVRVTYAAGTGDAPDDYYVVYIDRDTHRVAALRYVVSYAPFFEGKDIKHNPEKLLVYEDIEDHGGLKIAQRQVFYDFSSGRRGERVTVAEVTQIEVGAAFDKTMLTMPAGAVVDDSMK